VPGLAGGYIYYYLYSDTGALNQGYDSFLHGTRFPYSCFANDGSFDQFTTGCQSDWIDNQQGISGVISEYIDSDNAPAIACTENQQHVMTVLIGANGNDLLSFWNNSDWIVTS
jgi:hypothetical protein